MIDARYLIAAGIAPTQAKQFAGPLAAACALFGIDTERRIAAFVGQCAHESIGFSRLEESLYYTSSERIKAMWPRINPAGLTRAPQALANTVYANRLGNGPSETGDGWRYRGRGLIQLTGRANYGNAQAGCGRPYLDQPELLAQPDGAALSAAWWWHDNGCNALADRGDLDAITRRVNGPAMAGRAERLRAMQMALEAFGDVRSRAA